MIDFDPNKDFDRLIKMNQMPGGLINFLKKKKKKGIAPIGAITPFKKGGMAKKKKKTTIKTPGLKFKGFKKGGVTRKKYNKGGVVKPFDHYKASGL
jgi:hypothetical protein